MFFSQQTSSTETPPSSDGAGDTVVCRCLSRRMQYVILSLRKHFSKALKISDDHSNVTSLSSLDSCGRRKTKSHNTQHKNSSFMDFEEVRTTATQWFIYSGEGIHDRADDEDLTEDIVASSRKKKIRRKYMQITSFTEKFLSPRGKSRINLITEGHIKGDLLEVLDSQPGIVDPNLQRWAVEGSSHRGSNSSSLRREIEIMGKPQSSSKQISNKKTDGGNFKVKKKTEIDLPERPKRCELVGDKDWFVEYYKHESDTVVIEDAKMNQNLQVHTCEDFTVHITKKINNVFISSCHNVNVIIEDLIAAFEIVNSTRVKVQILKKCPSVVIDNCTNVTIYINEVGKNTIFTTSKSSDMNVNVIKEDGDIVEIPIPHQFVHTVTENLTITSAVSNLYT